MVEEELIKCGKKIKRCFRYKECWGECEDFLTLEDVPCPGDPEPPEGSDRINEVDVCSRTSEFLRPVDDVFSFAHAWIETRSGRRGQEPKEVHFWGETSRGFRDDKEYHWGAHGRGEHECRRAKRRIPKDKNCCEGMSSADRRCCKMSDSDMFKCLEATFRSNASRSTAWKPWHTCGGIIAQMLSDCCYEDVVPRVSCGLGGGPNPPPGEIPWFEPDRVFEHGQLPTWQSPLDAFGG